MIVAIDAKRNGADSKAGSEQAFRPSSHGGRVATGRDAIAWAKEAEDRGAGEILLTSMDRDGTGVGFDCELTRAIAQAVRIPVIASGGAGGAEHFVEVFREGAGRCGAGRVHFSLRTKFDLGTEEAPAGRRDPREVAVLIPSIDLMGGKIVQLVQGDKKALEFDNFDEWVTRFSSFPLVQLIDLDAAMGREPNAESDQVFREAASLPGRRRNSLDRSRAHNARLSAHKRVILGSTLIQDGAINVAFAKQLAAEFGAEKLVFAIDARGGKVAIRGWKEITSITPLEMVKALDPFCCAFLYTHIDTEGLMGGLPLEPVRELRRGHNPATDRRRRNHHARRD